MCQVFFYVSCTLSIIAFLVFVALGAQRFLVLQAVNERLKQHELAHPEKKGMQTELQSGLEGADKIIEALAKLTDSLSKAPFHVAALIGSTLFLLIALAGLAVCCQECKPEEPRKEEPKTTTSKSGGERCTVGAFREGGHDFATNIEDIPEGCFNSLQQRLKKAAPSLLLVVGHSDLRELNPVPRRIYASNLSLGYQRALAIRTMLLDAIKGQADYSLVEKHTLLLAAGASNIRGKNHVSTQELAEDRVVDIFPLWREEHCPSFPDREQKSKEASD